MDGCSVKEDWASTHDVSSNKRERTTEKTQDEDNEAHKRIRRDSEEPECAEGQAQTAAMVEHKIATTSISTGAMESASVMAPQSIGQSAVPQQAALNSNAQDDNNDPQWAPRIIRGPNGETYLVQQVTLGAQPQQNSQAPPHPPQPKPQSPQPQQLSQSQPQQNQTEPASNTIQQAPLLQLQLQHAQWEQWQQIQHMQPAQGQAQPQGTSATQPDSTTKLLQLLKSKEIDEEELDNSADLSSSSSNTADSGCDIKRRSKGTGSSKAAKNAGKKERNRLHARKSRDRKKKTVAALHGRAAQLTGLLSLLLETAIKYVPQEICAKCIVKCQALKIERWSEPEEGEESHPSSPGSHKSDAEVHT